MSSPNNNPKNFWKLLWAIPALQIILVTIVLVVAASASVVVGKTLYDLEGVQKHSLDFLDDPTLVSADTKDVIEDEVGNELRASLDCSNFSPAVAQPGVNCLDGLIAFGEGKTWSPVPENKRWMVPVWQAAATKYQLPWELLAAVNGARTQFGKDDCDGGKSGSGFYRLPESYWQAHAIDAGEAKLEETGGKCLEARPPAEVYEDQQQTPTPKSNKATLPGSSYDPVDSSFAVAAALADEGATQAEWDYKGSPADSCTEFDQDGKIYYAPSPPLLLGTGLLGYNKNLEIPRALVQVAARWRSDTGPLKPRRADDPLAGTKRMPPELTMQMLVAAWIAFGKSPQLAQQYAALNFQQIGLESGGRPYILQGHIGDVNDDNPAGGLFQFIPETFDTWAVSGFEDRFNPLDNILAAVNAQVNSGMGYVLDGSSGWGPGSNANPYTTGGKAIQVTDDAGMGAPPAKEHPYQGKPQIDPTSAAVAYNGDQVMSDCYVAVVYEWYQAIKQNPPPPTMLSLNFDGTKWISSKGEWVPCPGAIPHDTSNPCYIDNRIVPNLLSIHKKYGIYISDGYAGPLPNGTISGCDCHAIDGEHPLGLAVDINPAGGMSASWDQIDALALWAEPVQNQPIAPFRWVGYNGDYNHGTGNHLHLSWDHSPVPPYHIADEVLVFGDNEVVSEKEKTKSGGQAAPGKKKKPSSHKNKPGKKKTTN